MRVCVLGGVGGATAQHDCLESPPVKYLCASLEHHQLSGGASSTPKHLVCVCVHVCVYMVRVCVHVSVCVGMVRVYVCVRVCVCMLTGVFGRLRACVAQEAVHASVGLDSHQTQSKCFVSEISFLETQRCLSGDVERVDGGENSRDETDTEDRWIYWCYAGR